MIQPVPTPPLPILGGKEAMATPLQQLLWDLDPAQTIDPIERDFYRRLSRFVVPTTPPSTTEGLDRLLSRFAFHLAGLEKYPNMHDVQDEVRLHVQTLEEVARRWGGDYWRQEILYHLRRRVDGGLRGVLNTIADIECRRLVDLGIFYRVKEFLDSHGRGADAYVALWREYCGLLSPLLPNDQVSRQRMQVSVFESLHKALCRHPHLVREYRQQARRASSIRG